MFQEVLKFDDFTLVFKEIFQVELCSVKYAVGKVSYPVTQADDATLVADTDIERDVPVTKNKIFNLRMVLQLLFCAMGHPGRLSQDVVWDFARNSAWDLTYDLIRQLLFVSKDNTIQVNKGLKIC